MGDFRYLLQFPVHLPTGCLPLFCFCTSTLDSLTVLSSGVSTSLAVYACNLACLTIPFHLRGFYCLQDHQDRTCQTCTAVPAGGATRVYRYAFHSSLLEHLRLPGFTAPAACTVLLHLFIPLYLEGSGLPGFLHGSTHLDSHLRFTFEPLSPDLTAAPSALRLVQHSARPSASRLSLTLPHRQFLVERFSYY